MTDYLAHWTRSTFESAKRADDDTAEDKATWDATDLILTVECPKCHAAPGAWCEYATYHPGRFETFHVSRIRKVQQ